MFVMNVLLLAVAPSTHPSAVGCSKWCHSSDLKCLALALVVCWACMQFLLAVCFVHVAYLQLCAHLRACTPT